MVVGFRHHAALAVMRHRHGTLNGEDELALELFGDAHHMLIRALAFSGHDGGMEFKADDFEQHVGDARVRAVQQRDRTARAPLPLNPENGGRSPVSVWAKASWMAGMNIWETPNPATVPEHSLTKSRLERAIPASLIKAC